MLRAARAVSLEVLMDEVTGRGAGGCTLHRHGHLLRPHHAYGAHAVAPRVVLHCLFEKVAPLKSVEQHREARIVQKVLRPRCRGAG